jgi:hypothetical protein
MSITHRYLNELESIEQQRIFCGEPISTRSNILIIGTFNPSDESCEKLNNARWFYGRKQSKFWRYLPTALTGQSLHPNDNQFDYPLAWKQFCVTHKIVIIDLVKSININEILPKFGDREVESMINPELTNTRWLNVHRQRIYFNDVLINTCLRCEISY